LAVLVLPAVVALSIGCSCGGSRSSELIWRAGERVRVGPLTYSLIQADWNRQWTREGQPLLAQNRFVVVHLSITNAANNEIAVPLLTLEDEKGNVFQEITEVGPLPEWIGLLRTIGPSDTLTGTIVFDVEPSNYRLRVTDGGEPDREVTALIEVPLRLADGTTATPLPAEL
jgi:hypothetical protein